MKDPLSSPNEWISIRNTRVSADWRSRQIKRSGWLGYLIDILQRSHSAIAINQPFVEKMQERGLATIIEKSSPYKNRGESLQHRVYLEVDLLLDAPHDEIKPL